MKKIHLFTPLQADFYPFDAEEYGDHYNDDDGIPLDGSELVDYEETIRAAVRQRNELTGENLMSYFSGSAAVQSKVVSAVPDVAVRQGRLWSMTRLTLREDLDESELQELLRYLTGQYADGWGEGFEQQRIRLADGDLYVHFWRNFDYTFQIQPVEQPPEQTTEPKPVPRPKMKLHGMDGNIFAILGRASRLLRESGRADQVKEMTDRVYGCGDYTQALAIVSEYVETELTPPQKKPSFKDRRDGRER